MAISTPLIIGFWYKSFLDFFSNQYHFLQSKTIIQMQLWTIFQVFKNLCNTGRFFVFQLLIYFYRDFLTTSNFTIFISLYHLFFDQSIYFKYLNNFKISINLVSQIFHQLLHISIWLLNIQFIFRYFDNISEIFSFKIFPLQNCVLFCWILN